MNVRAAAASALAPVITQQASLAETLPMASRGLSDADSALLKELCFGTCRWSTTINAVLEDWLTKPLKAKDADIQALLMLGIYQLHWMKVPSHAAVNESVSACQSLKKIWAKKLVNGLLRRFLREPPAWLEQGSDDPVVDLAHPLWLIEKLQSQWPDHWQDICRANNEQAPMTLRVNQRHYQRDEYLQLLRQSGKAAEPTLFSPVGITLEKPCAVTFLPGFAEGWVSVQDEAAQLAAILLNPQVGERVLDACAAPGGKTAHLLEQQPGIAELVSLEVDAKRHQRTAENLHRLGLQASCRVGDALRPDQWHQGESYDAILLDAPCSASGVIRRHPDIKLLRRPSDIAKLAAQQSRLLDSLWPLLKPGGRLLYATCSIFFEEDDAVIADFVARQDDAALTTIDASWGIVGQCGRYLLPRIAGHDGFYYAMIIRQPQPLNQ